MAKQAGPGPRGPQRRRRPRSGASDASNPEGTGHIQVASEAIQTAEGSPAEPPRTAGRGPNRSVYDIIVVAIAIAAAAFGFVALKPLPAIGGTLIAAGALLAFVNWHRDPPGRVPLYCVAAALVATGVITWYLQAPAHDRDDEQGAQTRTPAQTATSMATTFSPHAGSGSASSATASTSSAVTLKYEPEYIEAETSKYFFGGALRISVVAMTFDGEPLRHSATVVLADTRVGITKRVERWETGNTVIVGARKEFSVTIVSQGTFGATFDILRK